MTDPLLGSDDAAAPGGLCPFLLAADGAWRSAGAVREHRCTAVAPPAPLAVEKQRRLCLTVDHIACATYLVAIEPRATAHRPSVHRRAGTRTTPTVLDQGRISVTIPSLSGVTLPAMPALGQGALIGVLGIAFGALLIARLAVGGGPDTSLPGAGASASPSASSTAGAQASRTPRPSPSPTPIGTVTPTPEATPGPTLTTTGGSPTPTPRASFATYKIKSGDTLSAIAARFGTTVKKLAALNGITDPAKIHVGQVLKLP